MKILFLDDDPERTKGFKRHCPSATCVETASAMIELLAKAKADDEFVDVLFLDHDLGGQTYVDPKTNPNTGTAVVEWIVANRPKIGYIVIHTLNHSESMRMGYAIGQADYRGMRCPFINLIAGNMIEDIISLHGPEDTK